jgi:hypothetical protein
LIATHLRPSLLSVIHMYKESPFFLFALFESHIYIIIQHPSFRLFLSSSASHPLLLLLLLLPTLLFDSLGFSFYRRSLSPLHPPHIRFCSLQSVYLQTISLASPGRNSAVSSLSLSNNSHHAFSSHPFGHCSLELSACFCFRRYLCRLHCCRWCRYLRYNHQRSCRWFKLLRCWFRQLPNLPLQHSSRMGLGSGLLPCQLIQHRCDGLDRADPSVGGSKWLILFHRDHGVQPRPQQGRTFGLRLQ